VHLFSVIFSNAIEMNSSIQVKNNCLWTFGNRDWYQHKDGFKDYTWAFFQCKENEYWKVKFQISKTFRFENKNIESEEHGDFICFDSFIWEHKTEW
jgi:hypothetical protein